jgi:MFS family permease
VSSTPWNVPIASKRIAGSAIWGLGMGVHESIIPAAVATAVSPHRRASAYGLFTGAYGIAWFAGSAAMGWIYDHSLLGWLSSALLQQRVVTDALLVAGIAEQFSQILRQMVVLIRQRATATDRPRW